MPFSWRSIGAAMFAGFTALGCSQSFKVNRYTTNEDLFRAAVRKFNRRKWDNAIAGFEKLTLELPARDTLLPRSHYYLARAHGRKREHLLAAQSYTRLAESFPDDSLADDALLEAARSYQRLWRRPDLDAEYGQTALNTYRTFLALYETSPLKNQAEQGIRRLEEWFATKDYDTGMHYYRRKAYDSAIIYFKDVVDKYASTARKREAQLRLVDSYRAIRYREDANEVCTALRQQYPNDREVRETCGPGAATVAQPTPP